jgi:hypothetical protein
LDFGGALVDAKRANLAVKTLDDGPCRDAEAAEELHRTIDDALGPSVANIFAMATSVLARSP